MEKVQKDARSEEDRLGKQVVSLERQLARAREDLNEVRSDKAGLEATHEHLKDELQRARFVIGQCVAGVLPTDEATMQRGLRHEKRKFLTAVKDPFTLQRYSPQDISAMADKKLHSIQDINDDIDTAFADIVREHHRQRQAVIDLKHLTATQFKKSLDDAPVPAPPAATEVPKEEEEEHRRMERRAKRRLRPPPSPAIILAAEVATLSIGGDHQPRVPVSLRSMMTTVPFTRRVPSLGVTLRGILEIYFEKLDLANPGIPIAAVSYLYYVRKYGTRERADLATVELVKAIEYHRDTHRRVARFAEWLGIERPPTCGGSDDDENDDAPSAGRYSTEIMFTFLLELRRTNELTTTTTTESGLTIAKHKAIDAAKRVFGSKLPDGGDQLLENLLKLPGQRRVDFDDLVDVTCEAWADANDVFAQHAAYLFQKHASLFKVADEMRFATDDGDPDADALIIQQDRPAGRLYRPREKRKILDDDDTVVSNKTRPDLVPLLTFDGFNDLLRTIYPSGLDDADIIRLFNVGKHIARKHLEVFFDDLWHQYQYTDDLDLDDDRPHPRRCPPSSSAATTTNSSLAAVTSDYDARFLIQETNPAPPNPSGDIVTFWYSPRLNRSQWTTPFHIDNFHADEIDLETFAALCLDELLFASSPLAKLLHKAPADLWPMASHLLAELQEKANRAAADVGTSS